jgi:UDPglucose 6-dehydrogenase
MNIVMIGAGYVGLVAGACFADFGHRVTCVDIDEDRVAQLMTGKSPIYEPGLDQLLATNLAAGRLSFTTDANGAVATADVVFLAVGTPTRGEDGEADLSFVHAAALGIAPWLRPDAVIAVKSTVPVGTGDHVAGVVRLARQGDDIAVVSNPEFMREGAAIDDFKRPDRIIIGVEDERARAVMAEVYRPLYLNQAPILFTSRRSAEITKYAANAFLAMKVTFINEMADLCEASGGNVQDIARGLGLDRRIGPKFLNAGPGYGGSCFPKDTRALLATGRNFGLPMRLVEATIAVNAERQLAMVGKIVDACGGDVAGRRIGLLGLTFKPETDDIRESPAVAIARMLLESGAEVIAYDPAGAAAAKAQLPALTVVGDAYEAAEGVAVLVLVTEWNAFRSLDVARLRSQMGGDVFVDLRNVYRADEITRHGLRYVSVGRPVAPQEAAE